MLWYQRYSTKSWAATHGRIKLRTTEEEKAAKKKERERKVKLYRAGIDRLFLKRRKGEYDEEAMEICEQLLTANPDIYTIWNIRREVIETFRENRFNLQTPPAVLRTEDELQSLLEGELRLTEQCLRNNPKSYGAWHHRVWVLDNMVTPDWGQELGLCNKYLELDERNYEEGEQTKRPEKPIPTSTQAMDHIVELRQFVEGQHNVGPSIFQALNKLEEFTTTQIHCWDYRRVVVERSQVPSAKEFHFSTGKIEKNFSNYSAWHYRSKLLPLIHPDPQGRSPIAEKKHEEVVTSDSQNLGIYLNIDCQKSDRWLLGRAQPPLALAQAYVSHNLVSVSLTHSIHLDHTTSLDLVVGGTSVPGSWRSSNGYKHSHVWVSFHALLFSPSVELFQGDSGSIPVQVHLNKGGEMVHSLTTSRGEDGSSRVLVGERPQFGAQFSVATMSVLQEQLKSCSQLLELEPGSKWTLLTSVLLMQAIDRHRYKMETMRNLEELLQVDPLRSGYYRDLESRYVVEYALEGAKSLFEIDLANSNLTALYHSHYMSIFQRVNLGSNHLSRSLPRLHALQCCQVLTLDNNGIKSLEEFPALASLRTLSLRDNLISSVAQVDRLKHCLNIGSLDLTGNPVETEGELTDAVLTLDNNGIKSLEEFPALASLRTLSLRDNLISSVAQVDRLKHCLNIGSLDLTGNPVETEGELTDAVRELLSSIHTLNGKRL
uniref:Geranylgeranyl transferase type-2 subunit alpha n=1 Tax=Timema bartmani TaxID=61472 RepID=A0A7R9I248_9NEOP|nr:unnamed protein product [Timema bartmani]